jgi:SAM-dependent methyltransferase
MLASVERYYTAKVCRYGATAQGVDWNSALSQRLRFVQLLKLVTDWSQPLSLHDLGCGYGALLDHLADRHADAAVRYIGSDVSAEMIRRARRQRRPPRGDHPPDFIVATAQPPDADYSVASGIFNVKLEHPVPAWEQHVASTLAALSAASRKGFAVNFMAPQALAARPGAAASLYGPPPEHWVAYSRDVLGCAVEVIAGYGLPEYTLLARRAS